MAAKRGRTGEETGVLAGQEARSDGGGVAHVDEVELGKLLMARVHASRSGLHLFRRNVGVFRQMFGPGKIRVGIKGMADLYGWDHTGRAVEIELKMHGKKLRPEQLQWSVVCVASNVRYYLLEQRNHEDSEQTITRWMSELMQ